MGGVVKIDGWQCEMPKCRHIWPVLSRADRRGVVRPVKPRRCPECKSTLWERGPRSRQQISEAARRAANILWITRPRSTKQPRSKADDPAQERMFA